MNDTILLSVQQSLPVMSRTRSHPRKNTKLHTTIGTDNVRNGMCKRKGEMIRDTAIQAANNLPVVLYTAQSRNPHLHTFQLLSLRDWGFFLVLTYISVIVNFQRTRKRRIILGIFVLLNPKLKLGLTCGLITIFFKRL